jgi:N-acetylmuramoyl-L-alanine amidase
MIKLQKNSNLRKNLLLKKITKAFQRRFRPNNINGKVDKECLIISQDLIKR